MNALEKLSSSAGQCRVTLITQAESAIGVATAQTLAESGADLALASATPLDAHFLESLRVYGGRVIALSTDRQASPNQATQLVRAVVAAFGRLDVIVANTIIRVEGQIDDEDVDQEALDLQLCTNINSVISLVKAASKVMNDGGRVVAVGSSIADRVGTPGLAEFAATRAALAAFCKGAAHDLGPRRITVNVVQVGALEVDGDRTISKEVLAAEREANALKRLGQPSEVAAAISFLASADAAFITGSVLNVDGGYNA